MYALILQWIETMRIRDFECDAECVWSFCGTRKPCLCASMILWLTRAFSRRGGRVLFILGLNAYCEYVGMQECKHMHNCTHVWNDHSSSSFSVWAHARALNFTNSKRVHTKWTLSGLHIRISLNVSITLNFAEIPRSKTTTQRKTKNNNISIRPSQFLHHLQTFELHEKSKSI